MAVFAPFTVTRQLPLPLHAPSQPANVEPPVAVAVSTTPVPAEYISVQSPGQAIPAGVLPTTPVPDPPMITVTRAAADEDGVTGLVGDDSGPLPMRLVAWTVQV